MKRLFLVTCALTSLLLLGCDGTNPVHDAATLTGSDCSDSPERGAPAWRVQSVGRDCYADDAGGWSLTLTNDATAPCSWPRGDHHLYVLWPRDWPETMAAPTTFTSDELPVLLEGRECLDGTCTFASWVRLHVTGWEPGVGASGCLTMTIDGVTTTTDFAADWCGSIDPLDDEGCG
ncbi:MAG: hypothetical protein AAF533_23220 [Acidobacteriota bacterium]